MSGASEMLAELREVLARHTERAGAECIHAACSRQEKLLEVEDGPKPVRVIGPAIDSGTTPEEISAEATAIEDEITFVCPWDECESEEFHEAWRLWSLARADLELRSGGILAKAHYATSRVEWDSAHDAHLECALCSRPVDVSDVVEGEAQIKPIV